MFPKTITIDFDITVKASWRCVECNHLNKTEYRGSPYESEADSPPDVDCKKCGEFHELNFYSNK